MHSKNPDNRPASAAEVERQLAIIADPTTVEYKPGAEATRPERQTWSVRFLLAVTGTLGLLLLAGAILV
jgi:hypothetical protein